MKRNEQREDKYEKTEEKKKISDELKQKNTERHREKLMIKNE